MKQALFERVDRHRAPHAIVSSNTSGIPIAAIVEGRSPSFRAHALGTHFFNPPRYLRLVEIIRTADTDPAVEKTVVEFCDHRLGKGVVAAKDTPNFIANRIGLYGVMQILRTWTGSPDGSPGAPDAGLSIQEIDAITGPAIGRPKSATFRTMDLAGIDVLAHVVSNLAGSLAEEDRGVFALPAVVSDLVERGWVGTKSGQGFYKKDASGEILTLEPSSMTYGPGAPARLPSLDAAKAIEDAGARIKALFGGKDKVGQFLRATLAPTLLYAARVAPEVAYSIDDVDRAMRWGFGWELGPFETWDAIGIEPVLEACGVSDPPPLVRDALARGGFRGKRDGERYERVAPAGAGLQLLRTAKERTAVVRRNAGASLIDLGDEVLGVEFHSKMNAIGGDTIQMLQAGVKEAAGRLPRARRRQRRAELLRRREPDAPAARSAGRQLGRDRPHGPRLSGRDDGAEVRRSAGGRRAGGAGAWWRVRGRAPCRPRAGGGGNLHGAGRGRRRPDPRWRRHQGDAGARRSGGRLTAGRPARVRDDRVRQGVDERA